MKLFKLREGKYMPKDSQLMSKSWSQGCFGFFVLFVWSSVFIFKRFDFPFYRAYGGYVGVNESFPLVSESQSSSGLRMQQKP